MSVANRVHVGGLAVRYDVPYQRFDPKVRATPFIEVIERGACRNGGVAFLLADHDPDQIYASTKDGTLDLIGDRTGLWYQASFDRRIEGVEELVRRYRNGGLRFASWGADEARCSWEGVAGGRADPAFAPVCRVTSGDLVEVSLVDEPINPNTTCTMYPS